MSEEIKLDLIDPNPNQPRRVFDPEELQALAVSITANGVIQPVVVEARSDGRYWLHDGERRVRAARLAGLATIPAHVTPSLNGTGDHDRLVRALVANLQRADLSPVEEARAYAEMQNRFGLTMEQIARQVGVGYHRVTGRLLLLALDKDIQDLIGAGRLSGDAAVARALLDIPDPQARLALARSAVEKGATRKAILATAKKVAGLAGRPSMPADDSPALALGLKGARQKFNLPDWDALAQLGRVVPWPIVEQSTRTTCDGCVLRPMAGPDTCGQCPAVQLLSLMIDMVAAGKKNREKVYGR